MQRKSTWDVNMGMARLAIGLTVAILAHAEGPTFEVAAIKVNKTESRNSGFRRAGPGQLNATNASLKMLIEYAYDVRDYQLTGGPNWLDTERYDILAKPPADADADIKTAAERTAHLRQRVQALLADRFQLTLHRTTKELPIYALTVAKNGPKGLKEPDGSASDLIDNGHHLTCHKVSIEMMAKVFLQGALGRPVVDHTGIKGEFDFTLDWVADVGVRRPPGEAGAEPVALPEGPSLFTALQEQLGLKLEPQKGPVEILVVDRVEKPSEN